MKKIYFILVIFLLGELQEINYQNVKYGEYIMQYALVKYIQNGNSHTITCPDCYCFFTVKDNIGKNYLYNNRTIKIMDGLYGYAPNRNEILPGDYLLFTNCTSALYGSEVVMSNLKIMDELYINSNEDTENNTQSDICLSANTCSGLSCIVPYLSCFYSKFVDFTEIITSALTRISDGLYNLIDKIVNIDIKQVIMLGIWGIVVQIVGVIFLVIAPFLILLFLLFLLLEVFIVAYVIFTSREKTSYDYIKLYTHGHYYIGMRIYLLFVSLIKMIPLIE